ncbi:MAG: ATPase domain-containing protein [archaeon]
MADERVKTYIPELDSNMMGGIPIGHVILISGSAGTMKSSICFNVLFNEALNFKKVGLYVSLEQSSESLMRHILTMGMDLKSVDIIIINDLAKLKTDLSKVADKKSGTVIIVDVGTIRKQIRDVATPSQGSGWLNVIKNIIKRVKEILGCDLFVLDSLSALYVLNKFDESKVRDELFFIFDFFRDENVTTFLISEMREKEIGVLQYSEYGVEDFLSDGIIHLSLTRFRRNVVREVSIVKMRATECNHDVYSLEFKNGKFHALYGGQTPLL